MIPSIYVNKVMKTKIILTKIDVDNFKFIIFGEGEGHAEHPNRNQVQTKIKQELQQS